MTFYTKKEALSTFLAEYPIFRKFQPEISHQFNSPGGRTYNTFLISTSHPKHKKIIAKGAVYPTQDLVKEWQTNRYLIPSNLSIPRLIIPHHRPQNFLLQQFINGQSVAQITSFQQLDQIITDIGHLVGRMHSVTIKRHNKSVNINPVWSKFISDKYLERLKASQQWLTDDQIDIAKRQLKINLPVISHFDIAAQRLIHRDIYFDNFILSNKHIYLIDFGMAQAGDPLYDIGKFIMIDLIKHPKLTKKFISGYFSTANLPYHSSELIKFYTLHELLGTLCFANKIGNQKYFDETYLKTQQLFNNTGPISQVISFFQ